MPTLLIIDDNESVRDTLGLVFARLGHVVHVAENGEVGLTIFAAKTIDAAIVDINMPGINGVEVCRQICDRSLTAGRKVPVWLMTGAIGWDVERFATGAGALAVLHKPFDTAELNRQIEQRLGVRVEVPGKNTNLPIENSVSEGGGAGE
jgi:DNA-binding response OmpR family regulator